MHRRDSTTASSRPRFCAKHVARIAFLMFAATLAAQQEQQQQQQQGGEAT